jgi:hypothetical protein
VALSFTCSPPEVVDVVGDQPNIPITVGQMMDAAPSSPAAGGHQRLKHEADAVVERGSLRPPRVQIAGSALASGGVRAAVLCVLKPATCA